MLDVVGSDDVRELFEGVPQDLLLDRDLRLPEALAESEAVRDAESLADASRLLTVFAGSGAYDHHVPSAVDHLLRRSEFYTAYTPYQAEVAQGTLQAIYEFQTMICELTGMDVANASIYDGATATAEAVLMAMRARRRDRVVLAGALHPNYRRVVETYTSGTASEVAGVPADGEGRVPLDRLADAVDDETACVVVQQPNFFGILEELEEVAEVAHASDALLVVSVADPVSLALLRTPGEAGADIVAGEGQPFGNAMSYGGPALGLFAAREEFVRKMPGRIAGATVDEEGRRGYVLTLQTREQQIRREKATSNICTNQGLNALAATLYLAVLGREGLRRVAEASTRHAHWAHGRLEELDGVEPLFSGSPFLREFAVRTEEDSRAIVRRGVERGLLAGVSLRRFPSLLPDEETDGLVLAFTEKHTRDDIEELLATLKGGADDG